MRQNQKNSLQSFRLNFGNSFVILQQNPRMKRKENDLSEYSVKITESGKKGQIQKLATSYNDMNDAKYSVLVSPKLK